MGGIAETRQYFGLSQADFSVYLNVSRSLLMMAEAGHRTLPTAAFIKLAQLQKFAADTAALPATANLAAAKNEAAAAVAHKAWHSEWVKHTRMVQLCTQQLQAMQTKYQQAMCCLALAAYFKNEPEVSIGKQDELWLAVRETEANNALINNDMHAQDHLSWKIITAQFAADKALEMMNKIER